ncbi:putative glycosyltransferase MJ1607 [Planktothrix tepida]|uniref:Glycosyl transferase, group 1 family protein n=2 Tax=Planktothrix TaxID=54304 RepID=A0A1J1LLS5_9CYAN|nr:MULTISPECIES: glycosyltransferase family 4 protein [Planktothrix]CAD5924794.1 putative glycosyltransferase MJ1607 [Planktothrix pseudagardhii]CAD5979700.1 putative glycosyltransferase MJ1607 [Planktothrix tepida]CUR33517.1 Glycosyl transferase, group 1 family protein [Planktothrix tepida PCC 9214]
MNTLKTRDVNQLRLLIVADNISRKMGGEAGKNLYYLQLLQERNVDVHIICHARVREELQEELTKAEFKKIRFIEDSPLQSNLWKITQHLPPRIQVGMIEQLIRLNTQLRARKLAKQIIQEHKINLVFEPSPITPKGISCLYDLGVPVVIGPLSGGLDFPPAFQYMDGSKTRTTVELIKEYSEFIHQLLPGKLKADTIIVANSQTKAALPKGCKGKIYEVIECGVDLEIWQPKIYTQPDPNQPIRFIYTGRFVDWKGVEFLLEAFKIVSEQTSAVLELVGDGILRPQLQAQVEQLNLQNKVHFHGWMKREQMATFIRECDIFVLPAVREAGGNVVLEAMASALPVIVANWAGPAKTVHSSCGILVDPCSKAGFIQGLADGMLRLANSPELRFQMGQAGIKRVKQHYFDWDAKCDRILEIFQETLHDYGAVSEQITPLQPTYRPKISSAT